MLSGFILFGRMFIQLWAGPDFKDAYAIALVVMIPLTIPRAQFAVVGILKAKNKHPFYSVLLLITAIANIPMTILLIKTFGYSYAAVSTAIMVVVGHIIIMNLYYHYRVGIDIPRFFLETFRGIMPGIAISTMFGLLIRLIPEHGWPTLIMQITLYTGIYGTVLWLIGLNLEEKARIRLPYSLKNALR